MPRVAQYRRWVFTLNNPEGALDTGGWAAAGVAACVWQLECAPTTGTRHYQGYIQFCRPVSLTALKRAVCSDSLHGEPAEGTHEQCVAYCSKTDSRVDGPWWFPDEATVRGRKQGSRSDLAELAAAAKEGKSLLEISEINPSTYIRNYRGIQHYRALHNPAARDRGVIKVVCIWGPSGVGKTHWARRTVGSDIFEPEIKKDQIWFNGYNGECVLLLDEYSGQLPIPLLNRVLDPYAYQAPCKMAPYVSAEWTYVIILTNLRPYSWYPSHLYDSKQIDSVFRRIGYGEWAGRDTNRRYVEVNSREDMDAFAASCSSSTALSEDEEPPSKVPSRALTPVLPSPDTSAPQP